MNTPETLEERVRKFEMMELPGQPRGMHMGTAYLVSDLWREVRRLESERDEYGKSMMAEERRANDLLAQRDRALELLRIYHQAYERCNSIPAHQREEAYVLLLGEKR